MTAKVLPKVTDQGQFSQVTDQGQQVCEYSTLVAHVSLPRESSRYLSCHILRQINQAPVLVQSDNNISSGRPAKFIIFNTQFLVFNTQFIDFNANYWPAACHPTYCRHACVLCAADSGKRHRASGGTCRTRAAGSGSTSTTRGSGSSKPPCSWTFEFKSSCLIQNLSFLILNSSIFKTNRKRKTYKSNLHVRNSPQISPQYSQNGGLCTKNDGICAINDGICPINDGLCTENARIHTNAAWSQAVAESRPLLSASWSVVLMQKSAF